MARKNRRVSKDSYQQAGTAFTRMIQDERCGRAANWKNRKNRNKKNRGQSDFNAKTRPSKKHRETLEYLLSLRYQDYLKSDHWRAIRKRLFKDRGELCEHCGRGRSVSLRLEVHHLTYQRLGRERLSDLKVLCRDCHMDEHNIST